MIFLITKNFLCSVIIILFSALSLLAQGPSPKYYYKPSIELSWAQCYLHMGGGSKQKIPFLPVTDYRFRGPSGTEGYTKDVDIDAPVVFIGNGIVKENRWNSYSGIRLDYTSGDIDVTGKIVLFCYDFPDKINEEMKEEVTLENRIEEAAARKAAAVMLFSHNKEYPFLRINHSKNRVSSHIPVISITRSSAVDILDSIGFDAESYLKDWETSGKLNPES